MIYDHISNIDRYKNFNKTIYEALQFLAKSDESLTSGKHVLSEHAFVNVIDYESLKINTVGYETHKKYIDIQYAIAGEELVAIRQLPTLKITTPYNEERDVAFCADDHKPYTEVRLGNGYFVILNSNDAHMPQLCTEEPMPVKKAIVKVSVEAR